MKKPKKKPKKQHDIRGATLFEMAKAHRQKAGYWRTTTNDPHGIATALYVMHAETADILEKTGEQARKLQ